MRFHDLENLEIAARCPFCDSQASLCRYDKSIKADDGARRVISLYWVECDDSSCGGRTANWSRQDYAMSAWCRRDEDVLQGFTGKLKYKVRA